MQKSTHLLVIRFSALGDVAMSVPVLQSLLIANPEIKITFLTKPAFAPLFEGIPQVSVFSVDVKNTYKGFGGMWKLALQLKKMQIDQVADFHNVLRTKILRFFFFLFGIPCARIDKGRKEKKALTKFASKKIWPLKTTHQRYASVFEELGFQVDLNRQPTKTHLPLKDKILHLVGKNSKKWIGIAPFAAHSTKMYPLELMEKVILELDELNQYKLIIFGGGEEEKAFSDKLESKYQNLVSAVGKFTFSEELNLIANLDLMISMDSGNGHLAAMFGIPVLTLWGATHPFAGFSPFNQPKENQLLPNLKQYPFLPTSIYGNKFFATYEEVMRSIKPQTILKRIEAILGH